MASITDCITSFIDGRVRLRHFALKDASVAETVCAVVGGVEGVESVQANPVTGSLLIFYDTEKLSRQQLLELAEQGPCVIVGRCADYILKDTADCLKVFVHADMEKRAERIVRIYGETEEAPVKRLKDKDKRRAAYYKFYTDCEWGDVRNYHLTLDSGALGIETCVELITKVY